MSENWRERQPQNSENWRTKAGTTSEDALQRAGKHVGKRDRTKHDKTKDQSYIESLSGHAQQIIEYYNDIEAYNSDNRMAVDKALEAFLNIRYLRHEIWSEFLYDNRCNPDYRFNDTRFGEFCKNLMDRGIIKELPDNSIANKTPDILILINGHYVILGDITVSTVAYQANKNKTAKYMPLIKFLQGQDVNVKNMNFVIDHELKDSNYTVQRFIDENIINENKISLKKTKYIHQLATGLMVKLKMFNDNHPVFMTMLMDADSIRVNDYEDIDINIDCELEPDEPLLTERELANMVKLKTDEVYKDYFDKDFTDTEANFEKLIKSFDERDHTKPKSTLQIVANSRDIENLSGHDLLIDYIRDLRANIDPLSNAVVNFLPTEEQVANMKEFVKKGATPLQSSKWRESRVYGKWQYRRGIKFQDNIQTAVWNSHLRKGKKNPNLKEKPCTINPTMYAECIDMMETSMLELGSMSKKPSPLSDQWDASTQFEQENSRHVKKMYDYVRQTQAVQMAQAMSMFYQRLVHMTSKESSNDNIYVANNGAFIAIIPREHQVITQANVDIPFITIARFPRESLSKVETTEYDCRVETQRYVYVISKLSRMNITKLAHWEHAAERITATCSYLLSQSDTLNRVKEKLIGVVTYLSLDLHQKTSEFLDLLKYISYMPFADCSRLSKLVIDKMDIMLKTKLDVWVLFNIKDFMLRLSKKENIKAKKSKIKMYNGVVQEDSLGMDISIPSFINKVDRHNTLINFIEETQMLFAVRGKQFYGKQYLDQALTNTAKYNSEYLEECEKYGNWATTGDGDGSYPFDAKYTYSKDAIIHAQRHFIDEFNIKSTDVQKELHRIDYNTYVHHLTSLRGCVKNIRYRINKADLHTTSLDSALKYYESVNYDEKKCTTIYMACQACSDGTIRIQYFMSEKEQRGSGRPIATGTLDVKIMNAMVEKPEQAIGKFTPNNIVVTGKHKLQEQQKAYVRLIAEAATRGFKFVSQCTEDQQKFSENDNTRKYEVWIRNNPLLPTNVKRLQLACIKKNINREHLIKRIPTRIIETPEYAQFINEDKTGIKCPIGWPQGMFNNISTSVHCAADIWIVKLFKIAYRDKPVIAQGLVHSDDSCFTLACEDLDTFKLFTVFRIMAKKLFTLKSNDKKIWASSILGEIVSNYNLNGNVMVPIVKTIVNGFGNVMHHSWITDTNNQISTLQQLYRNGATIPVLTLMATILRQQLFKSYNIKDNQIKDIHLYPVELGGYPDSSPFELGVTGTSSHYKRILNMCISDPNSRQATIILKALRLSTISSTQKEIDKTRNIEDQNRLISKVLSKTNIIRNEEDTIDDVDFESVMIPNRADAFSCIRHMMPKSRKVSKTIDSLRALPFESQGLEFLVTRPVRLSDALGNLKAQTSTLLYQLAADKYTSSKKRMAMSQSIQATGKTVKICNHVPVTIDEARDILYKLECEKASLMQLRVAFEDDNNIINHCELIVNSASYHISNDDKRRVTNIIPNVEHNYNTVADLRQVLLYIIDEELKTNYRSQNTFIPEPISILETDSKLIKRNYKVLFSYYSVKQACNTIMKIFMASNKTRYWLQPRLSNQSIEGFLESLYGKTISDSINYYVTIDTSRCSDQFTSSIINTLYTIEVINTMYKDSFRMKEFNGLSITEVLSDINYSKLSDQDYLKYAVLRFIYFGEDTFINKYNKKTLYFKMYEKPQEFVGGKYRGNFICFCKYGRTTIMIKGEPGDLRITSNTRRIEEITTAMYLLTNRDFPYYKYKYAQGWANSDMWTTKFKNSSEVLVSYGRNTCIKRASAVNERGLDFHYNPHMKIPFFINTEDKDSYDVGENLRNVYVIREDKKVKIANIRQNLSCPLVDSVVLYPDFIEGFSNQALLTTRAIFDMTVHREPEGNKGQYIELLNTSLEGVNAKPLIYMLYALYANVNREFETIMESCNIDSKCVEVTMSGFESVAFVDDASERMKIDSSELILEDMYMQDLLDVEGALYKHKSIRKTICMKLSRPAQEVDKLDIAKMLFSDTEINKFIQGIKSSTVDIEKDYLTTLSETLSQVPIPLDLYCYVLGNSLETKEQWSLLTEETNRKLLQKTKYQYSNIYCYNIGKTLVEIIKEEVVGAVIEEEDKAIMALFD